MSKHNLSESSLETKLIHAGHSFDPVTHSLASPIYQTATFGFDTVEQMDQAWDELGYLYTREGNPSTIQLEKKLAALEGGEAAATAGSGMGAVCSTVLTLLGKGEHILCSEGLFFHSDIFFRELVNKMDSEVNFANFKDIEDVKQNIKENTSIIFIETPENPKLGVVDIQEVAELAHDNECIFIVDSTFAPPPIQYSLKHGADLVLHSLTKYINGHGDTLGGAVVGRKDLIDKIKYPGMPCYTGAALSPFNAWLIMRGMTTLTMRMEKHCENALAIAEFLEAHEHVEKVIYPALKSDPSYDLCQKQMNGLGGGIVSFWLKDGINGMSVREADYKLCNNMNLLTIATSLGEAHTLIQVENDNMIRIAVGLEHSKDLISDMNEAFDKL
ncbi:aminotransferase class I/II-fold pyridoxal phosphate-dependent enzyme [Clostridium sediminicola]|uniref:trans-sulfuration enzyme family protein n=1 Tax=Clostridium sediminicola TaxID=3114879 RepID=UPI0031F27FFC